MQNQANSVLFVADSIFFLQLFWQKKQEGENNIC